MMTNTSNLSQMKISLLVTDNIIVGYGVRVGEINTHLFNIFIKSLI